MKRPFFLLAVILILLILAFRSVVKEDAFYPGHISRIASVGRRHVAITGMVASNPFTRHAYFRRIRTFIVRPSRVKVAAKWQPAFGDIRVASYHGEEVKYGDSLLFEAALKRPAGPEETGSFDYRQYLARSGIYALATISKKDPLIVMERGRGSPLKHFAYDLKDKLKRRIDDMFRRPERYFLSAVLLGERQDIPREWRDIFARTQTMHLLAISGLHVGIVAFIILFFIGLLGLPQNLKYLFTMLVLIFYAVMVGGRPSVIRATIMGSAFLGASLLKRNADIYNSLGLAAAAILFYNPDQLFDYGFILSFVSVFFIIYMTPLLNRFLRVERIKRTNLWRGGAYYFSSLFSASCAVWLGLLPLSVNFFGIISPISVVVNLFAIPALFIIISLSLFSLMMSFVTPFVGALFAEAAAFFIDILIRGLAFFSKLPFSHFDVEPQNIAAAVFYYIALFAVVEIAKKSVFSDSRNI